MVGGVRIPQRYAGYQPAMITRPLRVQRPARRRHGIVRTAPQRRASEPLTNELGGPCSERPVQDTHRWRVACPDKRSPIISGTATNPVSYTHLTLPTIYSV